MATKTTVVKNDKRYRCQARLLMARSCYPDLMDQDGKFLRGKGGR